MKAFALASGRPRRSILATIALLFALGAAPTYAQSGGGGEASSGQSGGSAQSASSPQEDGGALGFIEGLLPQGVLEWLGLGGGEGSQSAGQGQGSGQGQGQAASGGGGGAAGGPGGGGQGRPPAVVAAAVEVRSVGEEFSFLGSIDAIEEVTIVARVAGFIQEVHFDGGDVIKAGDKLFQIEPAQYEAALQAAQAELASATAQFNEAERNLARTSELAEGGTVSQAQLDQAKAQYESTRGAVLQAQASVRQAQLDLNYTTINAPIDGIISAALITKGNYVTASSGALAELIQENPIWGIFPIAENRLATWRRVGIDGARQPEGSQVDDYRLSLILPNEDTYAEEGDFSFVGNTVDAQTGTVEVRVSFPNPDGVLLPNENVTLMARERDPPRLPVVPQSAVQLSREGRYVFTLVEGADDEPDRVRRTPIEVGQQLRGSVAVTRGVEEGDYVVVQGLQAIQEGMAVQAQFQDEPARPGENGAAGGDPASGEGQTAGQNGSQSSQGGEGGDRASGEAGAENGS